MNMIGSKPKASVEGGQITTGMGTDDKITPTISNEMKNDAIASDAMIECEHESSMMNNDYLNAVCWVIMVGVMAYLLMVLLN